MKKLLAILFCLTITAKLIFSQTATAPSGSGTSGSPYQITSLENLYWITQNSSSWGSYFEQTADINASSTSTWNGGSGFSPIGNSTTQFSGSYNGQGHTISGVYINRSSMNVGFFGQTTTASTIQNFGLVNVNITSSNYNTGGLVALSYGTINKCFTSGSVTGTSTVGGICGNCFEDCNNCYTTCSISGDGFGIGGFAGQIGNGAGGTTTIISYCYSAGIITATGSQTYVGGFTGSILGGNVTVNSNCFWDTQVSGYTNGEGGAEDYYTSNEVGKTTAEMKTQSTFTNAGWNFTSTWAIVSGYYPHLQSVPDPALPVELISFAASVVNNGILLNWQTATEVNNYGFNVECRMNNEEWKAIGFVEGNGNSNSPKEYSFVDENPPTGNLKYRLKQIDTDGNYEYYSTIAEISFSPTGVNENELPKEFALLQNYPNPFNPVTVISWQLPASSQVTLKVYDVLGNEVSTLVNDEKNPGKYGIEFDGSHLSSGMYIYQLRCGSFIDTKKFILMK